MDTSTIGQSINGTQIPLDGDVVALVQHIQDACRNLPDYDARAKAFRQLTVQMSQPLRDFYLLEALMFALNLKERGER